MSDQEMLGARSKEQGDRLPAQVYSAGKENGKTENDE